jgi:hypothetical protein
MLIVLLKPYKNLKSRNIKKQALLQRVATLLLQPKGVLVLLACASSPARSGIIGAGSSCARSSCTSRAGGAS